MSHLYFFVCASRFCQYVAWVTDTVPPYPTRDPDTWGAFTDYTSAFYDNPAIRQQCNDLYKHHIRTVQERRNTVNGKQYNNDTAIMCTCYWMKIGEGRYAIDPSFSCDTIAWQIANEPQSAPASWYDDIAHFIKQGTTHQLVSSGIESKLDHTDFMNAHASPSIDYCTCHLWVEK